MIDTILKCCLKWSACEISQENIEHKEKNKEKTLEEERLNPDKTIGCSKCGQEKHFSEFDFQSAVVLFFKILSHIC